MIRATPGFSKAKQICTPPRGLPLPSTSCARNPEIVLPSAGTEFGTARLKQLPPPLCPSGEHDWLTNWPKAAVPVFAPPLVLPQEEYSAIRARPTPTATPDDITIMSGFFMSPSRPRPSTAFTRFSRRRCRNPAASRQGAEYDVEVRPIRREHVAAVRRSHRGGGSHEGKGQIGQPARVVVDELHDCGADDHDLREGCGAVDLGTVGRAQPHRESEHVVRDRQTGTIDVVREIDVVYVDPLG